MEEYGQAEGAVVKKNTPRKTARDISSLNYRASLNIRRAEACEKIFRQSKQKSARIVDPIRRIFVTNDGKDSVKISCDEFLEVPYPLPSYKNHCPDVKSCSVRPSGSDAFH